MVCCKICGHEAESLQSHIRHKHGLKNSEYQDRYPCAEIYSESYREKLSSRMKKFWKDPGFRENRSRILKIAQNTPDAKRNHRNGALSHFESRTEAQAEIHNKALRDSWAVTREARVAALRKAHNSSEVRKRHSEATKKFCAALTEAQKEKRCESLRKAWSRPENREKLKKSSK